MAHTFGGAKKLPLFISTFFDMFLKGSRLVGKVRSVRFLTTDVAVMHAVGGTVMPGQTDLDSERNSVQTLVVVKRNGRWSLARLSEYTCDLYGQAGGISETDGRASSPALTTFFISQAPCIIVTINLRVIKPQCCLVLERSGRYSYICITSKCMQIEQRHRFVFVKVSL